VNYIQRAIEAQIRLNNTDTNEPDIQGVSTGLTDTDILATCYIFMVAGYDTTSALLSLLMYHLAIDERCQQRLYEEVCGLDDKYDNESVSKLVYLEACVNETLRCYSPVPAVNRYTLEDYPIGPYFNRIFCIIDVNT
jgi:cytochrome P450